MTGSNPNGIYSNGTAGEFYAQTEDEQTGVFAGAFVEDVKALEMEEEFSIYFS